MTDHKTAMAKAVREAARAAERAYKNANPDAEGLGLKAEIVAFKRRPREFKGFHRRAVALLLSEPKTLENSNAKLVERLNHGMAFKAPSNVLTEKLSTSQKRDVAEVLKMRGVNLDLFRNYSVSKIKAALRAYQSSEGAVHAATVEVAFTTEEVVIGGRRHPIHLNGRHRRVHAGSAMLNVDGLKALLLPEK